GDIQFRAFRWNGGIMTDLGSADAQGLGINNAGEIVGAVQGRAALWNQGNMTPLQMPAGASSSAARAIDQNGDIIGGCGDPQRGILGQNGVALDLDVLLDAASQGWQLYSPLAMNNAGAIVGIGLNPMGLSHAFLMSPLACCPGDLNC